MMTTTSKKPSDMGLIKALEVGESATFPIERICSIRTTAYTVNTLRGYASLSTATDKEGRRVVVTRNS